MNAIEIEKVNKSFKMYHHKNESVFDIIRRTFSGDSYEKLDVLRNVSFSVKRGEMIGVIGANGSGKTTLLRLISGIYKPDAGTIKIDGSLVPLLELGIGFHPDLTTAENIIMYGTILGFSKKVISSKVDKVIEFAELEKFKNIKIKNFSSGMYARLAFSTAIQVDPDILLLDEVLSVGDAHFQQKCFDQFNEFKKNKKTIVLVTHSVEQISSFCDKALLLHEGTVYFYGEPSEVLKKYQEILGQ